MKKLLGIILFLGFMGGHGQASTESIFSGYSSKIAPSPLTCPNKSACSTLDGFQKYYDARCLELKSSSGCSQALCRGACSDLSEIGKEQVKFVSKNLRRFTLREVCGQVCPTVTLSEVDIAALKKTDVLGKAGETDYGYAQHAQEIIQAKVKRETQKHEGRAKKQTEKQLGKEVGGYGITGLSKLKAKRDWEYKWLEHYKKEYNKEIKALDTYYQKNIVRLQQNFDQLTRDINTEVKRIEERFKGTSLESAQLEKKLDPYKNELTETPLECPAQPDTCKECPSE